MKRIVALVFALCMFLCACKSDQAPTTEPSTEPTTVPTEPTTEPTQPEPVIIRHPLNGSVLQAPYTGRATAVVLSNDYDALPQHGLGQADMIFEAEVEGGITRLLAVFSDVGSVEHLGPVRSARSFFNNISLAYNAPIIHCGGSHWGINGYMDENNKIENWEHINEQYSGAYFFRDPNRSHYLSWLNLFTNGKLLTEGLTDKGYLATDTQIPDYGLQFEESVVLNGETATKVTVNFRGSKTSVMTYDASRGVYEAAQYGIDHIDGNTGEPLAYANVFCLYTDQRGQYDGQYTRSFYTLIGEGTGHFATGGQIVPIKWSRADANSPFTFTLEDGTPVTLRVGTTYVGIASDTVTISYE